MSTTHEDTPEADGRELEYIEDSGRHDGKKMAVLYNPDNPDQEHIRADHRLFFDTGSGDMA